jgi:pimeloyl-ACP methyl ester carboxylesterase
MKRRVVVLVALLGALIACATQPTPAPTAAPTPTVVPPVEFVPTYEPAVCPFSVPAGVAVKCGFVVVPEDHGDPTGATIRIAVAVVEDESEGHRPDPVILLAGGPGEKVVANTLAVAQMLAPICEGRDFVIFDQRGAGLSQPALDCSEVVQLALDLLTETEDEPAARATYEAWMTCRDRLAEEGHSLSAYTTQQNAADVDAIRVALGYEQVNLWGGSYGSHLGQAVMRDHPQGIRSAVLESVWPLEVSFFVETARTVPQMILKLLGACAADEACNGAFPDLEQVLFEVIDRLNADPVAVTLTNPVDGSTHDDLLTGDDLMTNLRLVLYETVTMPTVPQAIYDVYHGDYTLMTRLSSLRLAYSSLMSHGMEMSMICTDDLIGRTPEEIRDINAQFPSQLVPDVEHELAVKYGIFGICGAWPVEAADPSAKEPVVSDIPTLLISGEYDGVTPPEFGRMVAGHLSNSYFIEVPGAAHSGESSTPCALKITAAFLDDPTVAPDVSCLAEMPGLVFAVPAAGGGIALQPYSNQELGIRAVVPTGWSEVQTGIFVRSNPAVDMAVLQLATDAGTLEEFVELMTESYGLAQPPQVQDELQANNLVWSLYVVEAQGVPRDIALARSGDVTLIVVLRSDSEERDALREAVFLPSVEAMTVLD